jgi:hypothetical protein
MSTNYPNKLSNNQSWLDEFYPKHARECTKEDALQHSLTKWTGLLSENLLKHLITKPPIAVDDTTCSLCQVYMDEEADVPCERCPLYKERGMPCDNDKYDIYDKSIVEEAPYHKYISCPPNPQPMIDLIKLCLEKANANN